MSRMADIAQQLDEQCVDYGFTSYTEALEQGFTYEVEEDGTATLTPPSNGLEMAHKAWLNERDEVLNGLDLVAHSDAVPFEHKEIVKQAYEFIREQCHD